MNKVGTENQIDRGPISAISVHQANMSLIRSLHIEGTTKFRC